MDNKDTFCILPYIHQHIDTHGQFGLCCEAEPNPKLSTFGNEEYEKIRKQMANGQKIAECHRCWTAESKKQISARQKYNSKWRMLKPDIDSKKILTADYRFSNHCNFACVYCSDSESTTWGKLLRKNDLVNKAKIDIDTTNLKHVYLAGGEPLLIPEFKNFCKSIVNKNKTELVINTNLSKIDDEWVDIINSFKTKCLTISVDSFGTLSEYLRWPMKWSKFESKVHKVMKHNIPIMFNALMCNVNYLDLDKLFDWMIQFKPMLIDIDECTDPYQLNLDLLKKYYPNYFLDATQKFLEHSISKQHTIVSNFLQSQLDSIHTYNQDVVLNDTIEFLSAQDNMKNISGLSAVNCRFTDLFLK